MKKIEILAIIVIALWVLTLMPNPLLTVVMARLYGPHELEAITWAQKGMIGARSILTLLVQIGIGIWLFIQAKRDKAKSWIWLLFGLSFGVSAAILYFLMQLVEEMKFKRTSGESG